jgi:hypothetical protein
VPAEQKIAQHNLPAAVDSAKAGRQTPDGLLAGWDDWRLYGQLPDLKTADGNLRARKSALVVQNSDQPAGLSAEWQEVGVHRQEMCVGGPRRGTNP